MSARKPEPLKVRCQSCEARIEMPVTHHRGMERERVYMQHITNSGWYMKAVFGVSRIQQVYCPDCKKAQVKR